MNPESVFDTRALIPQRPPFLFVDTIEQLTAERARGRYRFKNDEWFFAGHFPGEPIVPGVILVEAMAQLMVAMGVAATRALSVRVARFFFTRVDNCRFHQPLGPGAEIILECEQEWLRLNTLQARATVREAASGKLACDAVLRGAYQVEAPPADGSAKVAP